MSRQQQLELLGLHCTVCGGPLTFENCNRDFERYACPSCGSKYRLPTDIDRFKEYRAEMLKRFGSLSRRGAMQKPKQDMLYELDSFAKSYSDFVKDDSQYHLFYIAAITENFQIKFKDTDAVCQEAEDTYRIVTGSSDGNESYPIDVYGKKIAATYKRWSTPKHMPLWSKIAIGVGAAAIVLTGPVLASSLGRSLVDKDTGIAVKIDRADYGMIDKWNVKFDVKVLKEGTAEYSAATALLKNESEKYIVYDLNMLSGKETAQPNGSLKITMPLPEGYFPKNTVVYYIAPDGSCELLPDTQVTEVTGTVSFEVDHFSLYAIAERPFHVSFLPENGSDMDDVTANWGSLIESPAVPEREGYTFGGWYNGSQKWNFDTNIVGDNVTLKAAWVPNRYTVSFDSQGGSSADKLAVVYDSGYTLPATSRRGYRFLGWYDSEGTRYTDGKWTLTNDLSLEAKWEAISYRVNLDTNGGNAIENDTLPVTYDSPYGTLPTPTRPGHVFLGWFTSQHGGDNILDSTVVNQNNDHTLFAHWRAATYTAEFDVNGGEELDTDQRDIVFGKSYGTLPVPSREGYTFLGWFDAKTGGTRILPETVVCTTDNVTLYALWSAEGYTVTLNPLGGEPATASLGVIFDGEYATLPKPSRIGYTFLGWFTAENGGNEITSESIVSTAKDHTLYAHWKLDEYTLSFDVNGGEGSFDRVTITVESGYTTLPTPSRTGYTFRGWYTASVGGTKKASGSALYIYKSHTLYAQWDANRYTVLLDACEGSVSPERASIPYDSYYGNLPTPHRYGHVFLGWFTEPEGGTQIKSTTLQKTASEHTLYAHWRTGTYEISLNCGAGAECDTRLIEREFGSRYGELPTPTRTGYTFLGWFTDENGGNIITSATPVTKESHIIWAHWTASKYTVTLNTMGGTLSQTTAEVTYDAKYPSLPDPIREGYTFIGWYDSEYGGIWTFNTFVEIAGDHTLYAHWEYPVTLDTNGGTLGYDSIMVSYNNTYSINAVPERTGYTFLGWFTEKEGGEKITYNTKVTNGVTHTIYAHWAPVIYTVTLDTNGGECDTGTLDVPYESNYPTLPEPSRRGHDFLGWFTEREGGTLVNEALILTLPENHTLYAHWRLSTYNITWELDGGTAQDTHPLTYTYGTPVDVLGLALPVKDGMVFAGWYRTEGSSEVFVKEISSDTVGDITLTAKWCEATGIWSMPSNVIIGFRNTTASSDSITRENEYTIVIPKELWNMIAEGRIGIDISMNHYMEVTSQGNATATVKIYGTVNGEKTVASCSASAKGGGYGILGLEPKNGTTKMIRGTVTYTLVLADGDDIVIGSYCTMSSNKDNDKVKTSFGGYTESLSYRFYNIDAADAAAE